MSLLDDFLADPRIARLARALAAHPGAIAEPARPVRYAATAALLRPGASGPELLLIRRAEVADDPWSGHVAWPGGRRDPADTDLAATAIRETYEETGIDVARYGRLLGTLDDIHPRTPMLPPIVVRPFVIATAGEPPVTPNREIAAFAWVPLAAVLNAANWSTTPIAIRTVGVEERPVFRHGGLQVWGMTESMLRQLADRYRGAN
jgi:8-oxo-dGTP pyrophosphatase MutT (NUDIX family)